MPAIITHHVFGSEVYAELAGVIGATDVQRLAFYLGNIGPDPLLCLKALPSSVPYRRLGSIMHAEKPEQLLAAMHDRFIGTPVPAVSVTPIARDSEPAAEPFPASVASAERAGGPSVPSASAAPATRADEMGVLHAYALGFLCHYLLDSTVHPLVYAQEQAISRAGVAGLAPRQIAGAAHALIETELDEYLLTKKYGATVKEFIPHRELLKCPEKALIVISRGYAAVTREVYDLETPEFLFQTSVHMYRTAQLALDARRSGIWSQFNYLRILGGAYPHVRALSHEALMRLATMFANDDHVPWRHPFKEAETVSSSFDDLYEQARDKALALIPRYAQRRFTLDNCRALTGGINFRGAFV